MKFLTFYFSGTGNTKWACDKFSTVVESSGNKSKLFPIENYHFNNKEKLLELINEYDYIGFAHPIYGANIPPVMRKFIEYVCSNFKDISKPVYIINTFGYINAFGPICSKKLFSNTKFKLTVYLNIKLCNNISRPGLRTKKISDNLLRKRKKSAIKKIESAVTRLLQQKIYINGLGIYLLPGIIIRKRTSPNIANNYKAFSVDNELCSKCMLCVKNCPTKSIYINNEEFEFKKGCTACMRCYNFCPKYAIKFFNITADPTIYIRHKGI